VRGTAIFGTPWTANGANALRFWLKGSTSNTISANNKVKVQIREGLEGERWSFDIGNASKVGSWQQITVPFSALYYDGTVNPTGTTGALDIALIDQLRFFNNDNGAAITLKVDRIEAIKQ